MLEGDRKLTLKFARFNVAQLVEVVDKGYDIVCSCPTCGYMLKNVIKAGAYYSAEYMDSVESDDRLVWIPVGGSSISSEYRRFQWLPREFSGRLLRDEGYFSSISPKTRIMVAENTYDVGEYLRKLHREGELDTRLGPVSVRLAYYPPCHLREQRIGTPYQDLFSLIPGSSADIIDGTYCCGNGGIMGFKQDFHHSSIKIAGRLLAKIRRLNPDVLTTDCLSCRLQFNQLTSYKVLHPIQVIKQSYNSYHEQSEKKAFSN